MRLITTMIVLNIVLEVRKHKQNHLQILPFFIEEHCLYNQVAIVVLESPSKIGSKGVLSHDYGKPVAMVTRHSLNLQALM